MTRQNSPLSEIQRPAREVASRPWVGKLARFGFAAKGFVYFVIGLLAAQAALGVGGETTDTKGALAAIVGQPFGKLLLALVTLGLLGYALWRVVQTILDPEHAGQQLKAKHVLQRLGYAFSAIAYAGLSLTAIKLIMGTERGGGDSTQDWTARFMEQPFGQWIVGLAGLVVIAVGISYLYQAYKASFQRHFNLPQMTQSERKWTKWLGQFGIAARGIVFAMIGLFLTLAALNANASEARGLGGALAALAAQPFGPWLLGTVALGFIAYSIYSLIEARYRQLRLQSS